MNKLPIEIKMNAPMLTVVVSNGLIIYNINTGDLPKEEALAYFEKKKQEIIAGGPNE